MCPGWGVCKAVKRKRKQFRRKGIIRKKNEERDR